MSSAAVKRARESLDHLIPLASTPSLVATHDGTVHHVVTHPKSDVILSVSSKGTLYTWLKLPKGVHHMDTINNNNNTSGAIHRIAINANATKFVILSFCKAANTLTVSSYLLPLCEFVEAVTVTPPQPSDGDDVDKTLRSGMSFTSLCCGGDGALVLMLLPTSNEYVKISSSWVPVKDTPRKKDVMFVTNPTSNTAVVVDAAMLLHYVDVTTLGPVAPAGFPTMKLKTDLVHFAKNKLEILFVRWCASGTHFAVATAANGVFLIQYSTGKIVWQQQQNQQQQLILRDVVLDEVGRYLGIVTCTPSKVGSSISWYDAAATVENGPLYTTPPIRESVLHNVVISQRRVAVTQWHQQLIGDEEAKKCHQRACADPLIVCTVRGSKDLYFISSFAETTSSMPTTAPHGAAGPIVPVPKDVNVVTQVQTQPSSSFDWRSVRRVVLHTTLGDIVIALAGASVVPKATENFVRLVVERKFYNGMTFHRVIRGFMLQTGCPNGDGSGHDSVFSGSAFED
eukprot:PhM_4_TR3400/c3_g1_i4/m.29723/K12736/PPWD1; peptidylprolyl isomerase domain and WD repeat-containing protein 1